MLGLLLLLLELLLLELQLLLSLLESRLFLLSHRRTVTVHDHSIYVILENVPRGLRLDGLPISTEIPSQSGVFDQNRLAVVRFIVFPLYIIGFFHNLSWNSQSNQLQRLFELLEGIDGVQSVENHFSLTGVNFREDQSWTIAESDLFCEFQGLKMFGFSWHAGDSNLLSPQQSVDDAGFPDIRISCQADFDFFFFRILLEHVNQLVGRQNCTSIHLDLLFSLYNQTFLCSKETMVDPIFFKVLVPQFSDLAWNQIALVDHQEELLLADFSSIGKEIVT